MDDYFDDYNEYDGMVAEFKQNLLKSVKQEVSNKISGLEKENADLRIKQKNLSELEMEVARKSSQLDREIANAYNTVKYWKAKELFREVAETKYIVENERYMVDKCGRCNDKRYVPFVYPSGKDGIEKCNNCGDPEMRAIVTEAIGVSVDIRHGNLMIWYEPSTAWDDDEYNSMKGDIKEPYSGQDFADIADEQYRIIFADRDIAQSFADYLNEVKTS